MVAVVDEGEGRGDLVLRGRLHQETLLHLSGSSTEASEVTSYNTHNINKYSVSNTL